MLAFLKRFGLGLIYILIAPFVAVFIAFWAVYAFIIFVVEIFKGIKSFFNGKKFFEPFEEDIEAEKILSLEPYKINQNLINPINQTNQISINGGEDKPQQ